MKRDETIHELQAHRIAKDRKALDSIMNSIEENMNLFNSKVDKDYIFNLVTGRAVSEETASFLLDVNNLGEHEKIKFINECNADPNRFRKPIKRFVVKNVASECLKKRLKSKDENKPVSLKIERDIFSRLSAVAIHKKIDMYCLSFPLAPAPPALCYCTGEMHKTDKSALVEKLRSYLIKPSHQNVRTLM